MDRDFCQGLTTHDSERRILPALIDPKIDAKPGVPYLLQMKRLYLSLVAAAENLDRRLDVCYDRDSGCTQFKVWDDSGTEARLVGTFDTAENLAEWICHALDEAGIQVNGGCR